MEEGGRRLSLLYRGIPSKDERVLELRAIGLGDPSIVIDALSINLLHIEAAVRKDGIL